MKKDYTLMKDDILKFIATIVELNNDYAVNQGIVHRFNKKFKLVDYIYMILEKEQNWLHYSEINKIIKNKYNIEVEDIKVHRTLTWATSQFMNTWLWTYTLRSNTKFSWQNVPDLMYTYLKEVGSPKTLKEITDYILSRKQIAEGTVAAVFGYKNEHRFVIYNDKTIWLKEWWLWNVKEKKKREANNSYEISISEAFQEILKKNLIPDSFTLKTIQKIMLDIFWDKISSNYHGLHAVLNKHIKQGILKVDKTNQRYIYFLIK